MAVGCGVHKILIKQFYNVSSNILSISPKWKKEKPFSSLQLCLRRRLQHRRRPSSSRCLNRKNCQRIPFRRLKSNPIYPWRKMIIRKALLHRLFRRRWREKNRSQLGKLSFFILFHFIRKVLCFFQFHKIRSNRIRLQSTRMVWSMHDGYVRFGYPERRADYRKYRFGHVGR